MEEIPQRRISAASCVRIRPQSRGEMFVVEINRSRLRDGEVIITPIGGGIEVSDLGAEFVRSIGGTFERCPDLRIEIAESRLSEFQAWFESRSEGTRELMPDRELWEELIDEHGIGGSDLTGSISYMGCSQFEHKSSNRRAGGGTTVYFQELFDYCPDVSVEERIIKAVEQFDPSRVLEGSRLLAISSEEIRVGRSSCGLKISDHCRILSDT